MQLSVSDVTCARGGVPVLQGLGFTVSPGEILVLRGPNGIGKTTLLRTLAGLQPALSGKIQPGADMMAYAAHSDGLKATLTVAENLQFWASIFGAPSIEAALEAFALVKLRNRLAQNLSAGQKRRLGLARLLVMNRPIWILDEPTVSLDVQSVEAFADALRRHVGQGGMALVATHVDLALKARELNLEPYRACESDLKTTDPFLTEDLL